MRSETRRYLFVSIASRDQIEAAMIRVAANADAAVAQETITVPRFVRRPLAWCPGNSAGKPT
jgi:hypothetical protein